MKHKHHVLQAILSNHLGERIDKLHYRQRGDELTVYCHVPRNMRGEAGTYECLVTVRDNTYSSCMMIDWRNDNE